MTDIYCNSTNFEQMKLVPLYIQAYLINQKVEFVNGNPLEDRHWYLGKFKYNVPEFLLRTPNNELLLTPQFYNIHPARHIQLSNYFFQVIAFLIANEYSSLPANNFKIALSIGHSGHSTALIANFSGIDNEEYKKLYRQFYQSIKNNPNLTLEAAKSEATLQRESLMKFKCYQGRDDISAPWPFIFTYKKYNQALSFLQNKKNIIPYGDDVTLPLKVNKITLEHYDSLHSRSYAEEARKQLLPFIKHHQCTYVERDCPKQEGLTCFDWSLYNLYRNGLGLTGPNPTSTQLRELTEKKTLELAQAIVYPKEVARVKNNSAILNYRNPSLASGATIILSTFILATLFQWALIPAIFLSCLIGFGVGSMFTSKVEPLANTNVHAYKPLDTPQTKDTQKPSTLYRYHQRNRTQKIYKDVSLESSTTRKKMVKRR